MMDALSSPDSEEEEELRMAGERDATRAAREEAMTVTERRV